MNSQISTILFIGFGIFLAIRFSSVINDIIRYFTKNYVNTSIIYVDLKPAYKNILAEYSEYYLRLNEASKKKFEQRVARFMAVKEFIPRGGISEVSPEMKVMISSIAVQITFGLPKIYFSHFRLILIYMDAYYSTISHQYHYGEVNTKGYVILSWKNFLKGWSERNSGVNLGIHEMAHALHLENSIHNDNHNFFDASLLKRYDLLALEEMQNIKNGQTDLFRAYAATNEYEFFAVMLESFFERPFYFKSHKPELYNTVCQLLNQDPLLADPILKR